jgi:hypothetical protein
MRGSEERGAEPLFQNNLPLPLIKGKGTKGIGLISNPQIP